MKTCKFCKKQLIKKQLKEFYTESIESFSCYLCDTEYLFFRNGKLVTTNIYCIIGDSRYRMSDYGFSMAIIKIKDNQLITVKSFFESLPNITPENVKDKISLYLLFK